MDRFRVLDHRSAVFPQLKLLHPLDVAVPSILIRDLKGKGIELVC